MFMNIDKGNSSKDSRLCIIGTKGKCWLLIIIEQDWHSGITEICTEKKNVKNEIFYPKIELVTYLQHVFYT